LIQPANIRICRKSFGWIAGYRAIKQLTSEFDLAVRAGAGAQLVAGSEVRSIASWENTVKGLAQDPSKFAGNLTATVGTFFLPGGEVGAVGDAVKGGEVLTDTSKVLNGEETVSAATNSEVAANSLEQPGMSKLALARSPDLGPTSRISMC
jgi:hypothetical protein